MQYDQESRAVSLLRDQVRRVQEPLEFTEDSKIFYDLDSPSSYDNTTFLIKLLLPRVPESLAANPECSEIHETIWVLLETFLTVNMLDEVLMNYTMIPEIWRFWEQKELRKVRAKNHCNQPISCFSVRAREKSLDGGKCPVSMTNDAAGIGTCNRSGMTLRRRCICKNSLTKQNFTAE